MSPGLAAMNDRAAAAVPFKGAAGLLEDLAGVRLTAKRAERAAEASGAGLAAAGRELRSATGKNLGAVRTGLSLPDGTPSHTLKRAGRALRRGRRARRPACTGQ